VFREAGRHQFRHAVFEACRLDGDQGLEGIAPFLKPLWIRQWYAPFRDYVPQAKSDQKNAVWLENTVKLFGHFNENHE
tara:strand:+ start:3800 stop:4033 length:234 start_codon:yes stop_codon:yes gene_type:complete